MQDDQRIITPYRRHLLLTGFARCTRYFATITDTFISQLDTSIHAIGWHALRSTRYHYFKRSVLQPAKPQPYQPGLSRLRCVRARATNFPVYEMQLLFLLYVVPVEPCCRFLLSASLNRDLPMWYPTKFSSFDSASARDPFLCRTWTLDNVPSTSERTPLKIHTTFTTPAANFLLVLLSQTNLVPFRHSFLKVLDRH